MCPNADLLLTNARVLTMDDRGPEAEAVAVRGDTILAVGPADAVARHRGSRTRVVDCRGLTLLPGLVDAHCHLLALAASLTGVDCGPTAVRSIEDLKEQVRRAAARTPPGGWIRAYGYDERSLAEGRHPSRRDLDAAAPHHPVRLDHRSGHAVVLNGRALELAGIHRDTPDPAEGVIQRDQATGEPTGVLYEMAAYLRRRLGDTAEPGRFDQGIARLNGKLLEYGITTAQDAGPGNDLERWATFRGLKDRGRLACRVTMMAGMPHLDELAAVGLGWGHGDDHLRMGHAKMMLTMTTGAMHPDCQELQESVYRAHRLGFPVAIHAIEQDAVAAAARALGRGRNGPSGSDCPIPAGLPPDRIEHCAECPPSLVDAVRGSGALVVTQPGFLYWRGEHYRTDVAPDLLSHLYPVGALSRAGVPLAFGSDAPVIDPNPWPALAAAVTRMTREGRLLPGRDQGVAVLDALRMHTINGARAEGTQHRKGSIEAGKLADLALVDADPTRIDPGALQNVRAVQTVLGGEVVWERL